MSLHRSIARAAGSLGFALALASSLPVVAAAADTAPELVPGTTTEPTISAAAPRQGALGRYLQLSPEQQQRFAEARAQLRATLQPLTEQRRALRQQLRSALAATAPDNAAIGALVVQARALRQQTKELRSHALDGFKSELSADQQLRLQHLQEMRAARRGRLGQVLSGDRAAGRPMRRHAGAGAATGPNSGS